MKGKLSRKMKSCEQLHLVRAPSPKSSKNIEKGGKNIYPLNHRLSRKGCTNFRWSPPMSRFLICYLVNKAKQGNANFKRQTFQSAAQVVSDRFNIEVTDTNVMNHVRTVRGRYKQIKNLQSLSNITWDESKKIIIMDEASYHEHIKKNPKDEPFLNKPIEMYEEICIICDGNQTQNLSESSMEGDPNNDADTADEAAVKESYSPPHDASAFVLSKRRRSQGQNGTPKPYSSNPRPSKKGCTNFRWSGYMSRFLLSYLVDQVKMGRLKRQILLAAARYVNDKLNVNCTVGNVENHLRTVRGRYVRIKKLQGLGNVTWDDESKMIIMDQASYHEHIKNEPKDETYLNKRIDMYEEMSVLFDGDQTGEDFTLDFDHETTYDHDEANKGMMDGHGQSDDDDENLEQSPQASSSSDIPPRRAREPNGQFKTSHDSSDQSDLPQPQWATNKMIIELGNKVGSLANAVGDLADAIRSNVTANKDISKELYAQVMKCEGFDEISLGKAFDYLNENEHAGRGFLVKNHRLRHAWLSRFFSSHRHMDII